MRKGYLGGVQVIARVPRQRGSTLRRQASHSVERIAHQRVPGPRKMNPDLVRSPRRDHDITER